MRFMSQDGTAVRHHNAHYYRSILSAFRLIATQEGRVAPFFRGCHVAVSGSVCAWGIFMYIYRWECALYTAYTERRAARGASASSTNLVDFATLGDLLQRFGFSSIASCTSALLCNPIWLIKTRMQLEEASCRRYLAAHEGEAGAAAAPRPVRHFATFRGGLMHSVREGGLRSLWRGVSAQMLLGVPMSFHFPLYDTIKCSVLRLSHRESLNSIEVAVCSFITRVLLLLISHPIMVLKTRLQDHRARLGEVQYKSFAQAAVTVWRNGGVRDFYRGLVPSLAQSVPRSVLMFVLYEQFLKVIKQF
ncbi:solute carrier family 25 (mitochondrial folate transporter), member 32 [Strigomonas culicis]|nr:solute carrier family 25 (mitochondrial folate transporter), member 32 [Strigomonas culicis]|eukprot:EPY33204.1 solute carrier family 25 (mitochondrial folate transporter), member 32 [Strigomonas culicis]